MNFEILILAVVIFLVANTYYDGKLLDALKSWSKYYQMGLFIVGGIGLYLLIKNNPQNGKELFSNASEVVKCLPIDKNSKDLLTPLFDFSTRNFNGGANTPQARRMFNSGKNGTKRSVSETKKINPQGYYAYTKYKGEELIKKYSIKVI